VELVLGCWDLAGRGGSQTYLLTVADHLQRLGHEVTLYSQLDGDPVDPASARGHRVTDVDGLPEQCDGVIVQDAASACDLAERFPAAPRVFVMHSDLFSIDTPPQVPETVAAVVVMSERVERHARALAHGPEVVRLRQPIDTRRFAPAGPLREHPERALLLGQYLNGPRRELLRAACADVGLDCMVVDAERPSADPTVDMAAADIVVGKGRVILEAMACGRAAYVFDLGGTDGWVTAERYPAMEADAFGGQSRPRAAVHREGLGRDLRGYRVEMGLTNRELVLAHHTANRHAQDLVGLLRGARAGAPAADAPMRELARMTRQSWPLEYEAYALRRELQDAHTRHASIERQLDAFRRTRRYRLAQALGRPFDVLRGLRRQARRG
jgi:hypothetical protein